MKDTTVKRPRTPLSPDSLIVQTFEVTPKIAVPESEYASINLTCAVNTQWVCGTGKLACPAC
ncbi:MAG TPA: hypothetical protein VF746_12890 [Longimicrobium sp.]